jgi:hypothetical protein
MLLRNLISSAIGAFRVFRKVMLYIGITLLFSALLFIAKKHSEIPDFMIALKEQMIKNPAFISRIEEYRGYTMHFDEEIAKKRGSVPFSVSINGRSDSVYVKITGVYNVRYDGGIEYTKKDTILSK